MAEENEFYRSLNNNSQESIDNLISDHNRQEDIIQGTNNQYLIDELVNSEVQEINNDLEEERLQTFQIADDSPIYRPVGNKRR